MTAQKNKLKNILGVAFGIAVTVGGVIGSGILYNTGTIAGLLNNQWLILLCWLVGGLYVLLATRADAELGTMIPRAGGPYNYAEKAFGRYAGFITGWFDFLINSLAPAYVSIAIAEYITKLFPSLAGYETAVAIFIIFALTLYHIGGVKNGDLFQKISSILKLFLFGFLIIACFWYAKDHGIFFINATENSAPQKDGIILGVFKSLQLIIGTYGGWNAACYFAEEFKNPGKQLPRALFISALIVIAVYLLFNLALLCVVPPNAMAGSSLVAADAANIIFGKTGSVIFTILAIVSLSSILNAMIMVPSRILFGLSRSGYFIGKIASVNKGGSPWAAFIVIGLLELIYILSGSFAELFSLGAFTTLIVNAFAYAAVPMLRKTQPTLPRPYRQWGYPYSSVLILIVIVALFVAFAFADIKSLVILLVITLISFPVFKLIQKNQSPNDHPGPTGN